MYDQAVVVQEAMIENISSFVQGYTKPDYSGHYLVPSFIDLQIYGSRGKLFSMYPTPGTLQTMYAHCSEAGTGHFLVTIATNTSEVMYRAIDAVRNYWESDGKGLIGLHLEGPWINPLKRGAHIEAFIKKPLPGDLLPLLTYGRGIIKMITLAPELCSDDVLRMIKSFDIIISAGHSNATYAEATASFSKGVTTVTHLFNAMSPFHHRDTGLPGATFRHAAAMSSIIVDGHHVDFSAVAIAKRLMGERLFLITDAVAETREGPYQHTLQGGRYLSANTLSGSALTMLEAVKNCVIHCEIKAEEALRMASLYPAKLMDIEGGNIRLNERASFILLDEDLNVIQTCL